MGRYAHGHGRRRSVPWTYSAARTRLESEYDAIVGEIYRAGAGIVPWTAPLSRIADATAASSVNLGGLDKDADTVSFSFSGGPRPPEATAEYARNYHRIDPRLALVKPWPVGKWLACQEHFDDDFVARDPFFQKFLLRYGSRYVYGAKIWRTTPRWWCSRTTARRATRWSIPTSGAPAQRLGAHIAQSLQVQYELSLVADIDALGRAMLDRRHQPLLLLDGDRHIGYRNEAAKAVLARGDVLREQHGILACRSADSDTALTQALRELVLPSHSQVVAKAPTERKALRLKSADGSRSVTAVLLALRSADAGRVGRRSRAVLAISDPRAAKDIDLSPLVPTFDLTPAEARVAARLTSGATLEEIATEFGVSVTTVRSQLKALFDKTGTHRQTDLVRLLVAATAF